VQHHLLIVHDFCKDDVGVFLPAYLAFHKRSLPNSPAYVYTRGDQFYGFNGGPACVHTRGVKNDWQ
jgi:hypothetical protein